MYIKFAKTPTTMAQTSRGLSLTGWLVGHFPKENDRLPPLLLLGLKKKNLFKQNKNSSLLGDVSSSLLESCGVKFSGIKHEVFMAFF